MLERRDRLYDELFVAGSLRELFPEDHVLILCLARIETLGSVARKIQSYESLAPREIHRRGMTHEGTYEAFGRLQDRLAEAQAASDIDTVVDCWLQIGMLFFAENPESAHMHIKLAEMVMSDAGRTTRLHEALGGQGRTLRRRKRYKEAVERFEAAERAAKRAHDVMSEIKWKLRRPSALRAINDLAGAKQVVAEVERLLQSSDDGPSSLFNYNVFDMDRVTVLAEFEGQSGINALA